MPEEKDTTMKQHFQNTGNVQELETPVPKVEERQRTKIKETGLKTKKSEAEKIKPLLMVTPSKKDGRKLSARYCYRIR